ncbi:MAG: AAA family ATPase [Lachnospiraceae bacterium]
MKSENLLEILNYINPASLDYQDWLNVGMALKHEGYTASVWDEWSRSDARYHQGECYRKWASFSGSGTPVTAGTIVQLAKDNGWVSPYKAGGHELDWNDSIAMEKDDFVIIEKGWLEGKDIKEPSEWNPVGEIIRYLETLFEAGENVGYVTDSWEKDGRFLPKAGSYSRTAGELIQELSKYQDIGAALGDYNEKAGAWIRFNPLDGNGCKNENVTEYRYALVESDNMAIDEQNAIMQQLELPIAALVYSGKKSLHAIVKIDAANYDEYRKRVNYLYEICEKNGLSIDKQNKNPSRLSRMPGVMRDGKKQYIVDTNIGKKSWEEWIEWIEGVNDNLPNPDNMADIWDNTPELAPPLIDNVLRKGHKMLIAGPSKAGKSFALIELTIALAEGKNWLGFDCAQGKVMYVNLELDRASCFQRFKDVYTALGWKHEHLSNIDIWNLRGKAVPMDKLAPKLIRRAAKKDYVAIIIDPIYKVITGDENSADQMANFCNQFDKICNDLGCAVIYCHHHSKGAQGGKRSMDRASGSGVFARDPDALLDLIELELTDAVLKNEENKAVCDTCADFLNEHVEDWEDDVSQDDMLSSYQMLTYCENKLSKKQYTELNRHVFESSKKAKTKTAWRIEGTLREFPKFEPINMYFDYPIHRIDRVGILKDIQPEDHKTPWMKNFKKKKSPEELKKQRKDSIENAFNVCNMDGGVTVDALAEYMGVTKKTVRNRLKEHGGFLVEDNEIFQKIKSEGKEKVE